MEVSQVDSGLRPSITWNAVRRSPNTPIWKPEAALKCRSCRTPRYSPPVHMIRLTETLVRSHRICGFTRTMNGEVRAKGAISCKPPVRTVYRSVSARRTVAEASRGPDRLSSMMRTFASSDHRRRRPALNTVRMSFWRSKNSRSGSICKLDDVARLDTTGFFRSSGKNRYTAVT
jgi:hypothetical protein